VRAEAVGEGRRLRHEEDELVVPELPAGCRDGKGAQARVERRDEGVASLIQCLPRTYGDRPAVAALTKQGTNRTSRSRFQGAARLAQSTTHMLST
jgi:hypothetical protein